MLDADREKKKQMKKEKEKKAHATRMKQIYLIVGGLVFIVGIGLVVGYIWFPTPSNTSSKTNDSANTSTTTPTNNGGTATTPSSSSSSSPLPGAPTNIVAMAAIQSASVSFIAPTLVGTSAIVSYTVQSTPGSLTQSGTSSPLVVAGLSEGVSYVFTVTATNSSGKGAASVASNRIVPIAPVAYESMYASTVTPVVGGSGTQMTLGTIMSFWAVGNILALRVYVQQAGTYPMTLRSGNGGSAGFGDKLEASVTLTATSKGWQTVMLPTPLAIDVNLLYTVAYDCGTLPWSSNPAGKNAGAIQAISGKHIAFKSSRYAYASNANLNTNFTTGGDFYSGDTYYTDVVFQYTPSSSSSSSSSTTSTSTSI